MPSAAFVLPYIREGLTVFAVILPTHRYEGDWAGAVYEGAGSETFAKGSTYHGEYSAGLRNGWGVCRFFNGDYYEGLWSKGLRDGMGMQQVAAVHIISVVGAFV